MPTPSGPVHNVVVVENSVIDRLVANEAFRSAFPYLASLAQVRPAPARPGCRRCLKKQRAALTSYRAFKNHLAAMTPQDKARFKQFLDCRQVRVVHVNAANRIMDRTF
jgi:phytoene dehydrogenase-like protein